MAASRRWSEVRQGLLARARRDQDARHALGEPPSAECWEAVKAVDAENAPWLESVVAELGWPSSDVVGDDGAHAAWILAQHAPLRLQEAWLPLLREAVEAGAASAVDLAYLDDRVRTQHGRPQRHGTQWFVRGAERRLFALERPGEVNDRRAELGLAPLSADDIAAAWRGFPY